MRSFYTIYRCFWTFYNVLHLSTRAPIVHMTLLWVFSSYRDWALSASHSTVGCPRPIPHRLFGIWRLCDILLWILIFYRRRLRILKLPWKQGVQGFWTSGVIFCLVYTLHAIKGSISRFLCTQWPLICQERLFSLLPLIPPTLLSSMAPPLLQRPLSPSLPCLLISPSGTDTSYTTIMLMWRRWYSRTWLLASKLTLKHNQMLFVSPALQERCTPFPFAPLSTTTAPHSIWCTQTFMDRFQLLPTVATSPAWRSSKRTHGDMCHKQKHPPRRYYHPPRRYYQPDIWLWSQRRR